MPSFAPQAGTDAYYACMFLSGDTQSAAHALFQWMTDIDEIGKRSLDASVAIQKLDWWFEQTSTAQLLESQHPLIRRISSHMREKGPVLGPLSATLTAMLNAANMDVTQSRYLDSPNLESYIALKFGAFSKALSILLGADDPEQWSVASDLGCALGRAQLLREVGWDARRDTVYIPISELQRHDIKAFELIQAARAGQAFDNHSDWGIRFMQLMSDQHQSAQAQLTAAMTRVRDLGQPHSKPHRILAALEQDRLATISASDYQVLHQRIDVTPLRKFWIGWKMQALGLG